MQIQPIPEIEYSQAMMTLSVTRQELLLYREKVPKLTQQIKELETTLIEGKRINTELQTEVAALIEHNGKVESELHEEQDLLGELQDEIKRLEQELQDAAKPSDI